MYAPPSLASLPPEPVEETAWDILLALHHDHGGELSLARLASIASTSRTNLEKWLADLEERALVTGAERHSTGELVAVLTRKGRMLLDRYLAAAGGLQAITLH